MVSGINSFSFFADTCIRKSMSKKPIWISHRGYTNGFSENTRGAFDAAIAQGFDIIETDLRVTLDKHIVLFHDATLKSLGRRNDKIESLTRTEVEKIKYSCGSSPLFLDDFIARYQHQNCNWAFDIKTGSGDNTIELLQKYDKGMIEKKVTFLCRTARHERVLRRIFPQAVFFARKVECYMVGVAFLLGASPLINAFVKPKTYSVSARFCGKSLFQPAIFNRYKRRGAKVLAYLPRVEETQQAIDAGADMILTDHGIT